MSEQIKEVRGAVSFGTAFVQTLTPVEADFDILGHVNNTVYLRWVQEMATAHWKRGRSGGNESGLSFYRVAP